MLYFLPGKNSLLVWNQTFCNSSFISLISCQNLCEPSSANSTGFKTVETISFIYNIKSNGPNIDPCGTPHIIFI